MTPVPAQPAESGLPISKPTKGKESFPIRWPAACGKKNYNIKSEERSFGKPSQLDITEAVHQLDGPWKRVSGWIHVTQAPPEQAAGTIEAKISYAASQSVDELHRRLEAQHARNDTLSKKLEDAIAADTGEDGCAWSDADLEWLRRH